MPSARDLREFRGFLRNATDRQVQGIYDKERRAGRDEYADLAVEEADRRGIYLEREDHARKKKTIKISTRRPIGWTVTDPARPGWSETGTTSPAQLQREIDQALASRSGSSRGQSHATIGGTRSFVDVIKAGDRVTIVDRFGQEHTGRAVMRGPHGWVLNMGGRHGTPGIATDENIVRVKTPGRQSHATKRAIPGVSKWSMTAGGTGAAEGKHGYTLTVPEGTYYIWPFTTRYGRHAGYSLKFAT